MDGWVTVETGGWFFKEGGEVCLRARCLGDEAKLADRRFASGGLEFECDTGAKHQWSDGRKVEQIGIVQKCKVWVGGWFG